jgi:hypothetical protein
MRFAIGAAIEQRVEGEAQIAHAMDCLILTGRLPQSADDPERVAEPQLPVAAHVLQMQACNAMAGEMFAQVAVAHARAADAVREHHQRHHGIASHLRGPVQPHRHGPIARGIDPIEVADHRLDGCRRCRQRLIARCRQRYQRCET